MKLPIKVVPGASRDSISGWLDERLKIQVSAPPENGKANAAAIKLLARKLDIPRKRISIVSGHTSLLKVVAFESTDETEIQKKISALEIT